ncbi:XdhC family protein [Kineococcus rhizosphaerae]|uniref:Xanthine dehydrogenase accessory factor n=1 Tax=Kineococcus rhizosphaerae TaxID=559628 RepID=A0A2T0QX16_9ACTN|nr:XdhC/CoxI family protein [Kineococcus rhizosphaerae]PRY10249.1 xanthine dehydrogenase accessory factor [Kineococcus rhizosphaerae]
MTDVRAAVADLLAAGRSVAVATVVRTWSSAPRRPGAAMLVDDRGQVVGSLSGGCVEGTVYELALDVLREGGARLEHFGVSDADAFAVGLTCGGEMDVLIRRFTPADLGPVAAVDRAVLDRTPVATATVVTGWADAGVVTVTEGAVTGSTGSPGLDRAVVAAARASLRAGTTGLVRLSTGDQDADVEVFVECVLPPPRMIVFGAVDFSAALARLAVASGFHVTVCDARAVFTTPERFPEAHEVVVDWPHRYLARTDVDERTVLCVLTHDAKFDVPLLEVALRGPAAYVGAMGSRRTHEDRLRALREAGVTDGELSRLRSPIGLDLGARTPEETAVSILAEVVAVRRGGSGRPLRATTGSIHRPDPATFPATTLPASPSPSPSPRLCPVPG